MGAAVGDRALTWQERFWHRVAKTDGCWLWRGGRGAGYGVWMLPGQRRRGAHVVAYELEHGPLARGLVIDHLCCNPICVRPSHLEAVSPEENRRRQSTRQTHCKHGHELSGANLIIVTTGGRSYRRCRECARLASQSRNWKTRGMPRHACA